MSQSGPRRLNRKKHLWKLVFASTAFRRVLFTCEYIDKHVSSDDDQLYHPLITAVCVTYAKPFTDNQGVGMLSEKLARFSTTELQTTHKCLIEARNLFYAHSDATHSALEPESSNRIKTQKVFFHVQYFQKPGRIQRAIRIGSSEVKFRLINIPNVKRLCEELLDKLNTETETVLQELLNGRQFTEGWHEMSIDDEN